MKNTVHSRLYNDKELLKKVADLFREKYKGEPAEEILNLENGDEELIPFIEYRPLMYHKDLLHLCVSSELVYIINYNIDVSKLSDDQIYDIFTLSITICDLQLVENGDPTGTEEHLKSFISKCNKMLFDVLLLYKRSI